MSEKEKKNMCCIEVMILNIGTLQPFIVVILETGRTGNFGNLISSFFFFFVRYTVKILKIGTP